MNLKDQPLNIKISHNGVLEISIGINTLAFCFEESAENNPWSDELNDFKKAWEVTDKLEFAKEVRRALYDEREDGSTILTDVFDTACLNAIEDGCMGVREIEGDQNEHD